MSNQNVPYLIPCRKKNSAYQFRLVWAVSGDHEQCWAVLCQLCGTMLGVGKMKTLKCTTNSSWDKPYLQDCGVWFLVNLNDLWPSPNRVGYFMSMCSTYIKSIRYLNVILLELSWQRVFLNINSGNSKWSLTSTKMTIPLELNMEHLPIEVRDPLKFHMYWNIIGTASSQFDFWWPQMIFDLLEQ